MFTLIITVASPAKSVALLHHNVRGWQRDVSDGTVCVIFKLRHRPLNVFTTEMFEAVSRNTPVQPIRNDEVLQRTGPPGPGSTLLSLALPTHFSSGVAACSPAWWRHPQTRLLVSMSTCHSANLLAAHEDIILTGRPRNNWLNLEMTQAISSMSKKRSTLPK